MGDAQWRHMFQSTPAHQDGRNEADLAGQPGTPEFQSTPAHQDGRNAGYVEFEFVLHSVSIHSRPPGREKRAA